MNTYDSATGLKPNSESTNGEPAHKLDYPYLNILRLIRRGFDSEHMEFSTQRSREGGEYARNRKLLLNNRVVTARRLLLS